MRYTIHQYVTALTEALTVKPPGKQKETIRRFLALLQKNKDVRRLGLILRAFERRWLKTQNRRKVVLASAAPISKRARAEVLELTGKNPLLYETVDPGLLAGVRFIVDDELLIDATARRQVSKIFAQHSNILENVGMFLEERDE